MLNLIHQLKLVNYENIAILLGKYDSCQMLIDIMEVIDYKQLFVIVPHEDYMTKLQSSLRERAPYKYIRRIEQIQYLTYIEIIDQDSENNIETICFDGIIDTEECIRVFDKVKPKFILGVAESKDLDKYRIWNVCRNFSEYLFLETVGARETPEVLEWKKDDNPIELSVVFPVYNVAQYLEQCIESIIQWDADFVEYLFVDDGSPDNSVDIINEYAKKDSRIKVLSKENGGCASARQYGMERAKGKYVGFIDPDDFIDPTMFRKLFARALDGDYDMAYCGFTKFYNQSKELTPVNENLVQPWSQGVVDKETIQRLLNESNIAIWRGIYKLDVIKEHHINFHTELRRFDDLPFQIEILNVISSIVSVPEHLYYYRLERPGQDVAVDDERLFIHFDIFNILNKATADKGNREALERLQIVKINTHLWALGKLQPQFFERYAKIARRDLLNNFSKYQGLLVARGKVGKKVLLSYALLVNGNYKRLFKLVNSN